MNRRLAALAVAAAVTWTLAPAFAQEPPPGGPDPQAPAPEAVFRGLREPEIRPYEQVITKDAEDRHGHLQGAPHQERLFYEIPKASSARTSSGSPRSRRRRSAPATAARPPATASSAGSAGQSRPAAQRRLRASSPTQRSPIARAVEAANNAPIIRAFNVAAFGQDGEPVIDVTRCSRPTCRSSARARASAGAASTRPARSSSTRCRSPRTSTSK